MIGEVVAGIAVKSAAGAVAKGATTALVKGFVDRVVTPFFSGRSSKAALTKAARTYYRNMDVRTRYVPTIAIQGGKFLLESVYEPLDLIADQGDRTSLVFRVDQYPDEVFDRGRCVMIVDSAGMGKSTLTKYIFRRALEELRKIPLLVELRRVKDGMTLLDLFVSDFLGDDAKPQVVSEFEDALREGNFVILLDGYDELSPSVRGDVSSEISKLVSHFPYCNFVLTSRPDPSLASFAEFLHYDIGGLTREQAFSLINRYDSDRGVAKNLIAKIQAMPEVDEFLRVPLLVTLLYKAFDHKAIVPIKRNIFYRQVFDALYQDHDLSKEGAFERRKASSLDVEEFHRFMRNLGFMSFRKGVVQYSMEEFASLVNGALKNSGLKCDAAGLRSDLISAVPLFVKEGAEYRWSHKSFQDYFAAQFIYFDAGQGRDELLQRMFNGENVQRHANLLSLIYEIDQGLVSDLCILPFIERLCESRGADLGDADMDLQLNVICSYSKSYLLDGDEFINASVHDFFQLAELTVGKNEVLDDYKMRRMLQLPHDGRIIYSVMTRDYDRVDFLGFLYGHKRSAHRQVRLLQGAKLIQADPGGISDLGQIAISDRSEGERRAAVGLIITALNSQWHPTVSYLEALRSASAVRKNVRESFSIFEGFC